MRIGQVKDTFVHKYLLEKTIEERIASFQQLQPPLATSRHYDSGEDSDVDELGLGRQGVGRRRDDFLLSMDDLDFLLTDS